MRIEVTNECNLNCTYCHAKPNSRKGTITLGIIEQTIAKNVFHPEMGQITISGGEPFLYPDLTFSIAKLLREKKFYDIKIQTNGTIITKDSLNKFKDVPGLTLKFSLDSHLENIHNSFRQRFSDVVSSIKLAIELGYKVATTYVITSNNYLYIHEYVGFCKELGVENIQFRRELGGSTNLTNEMLSESIQLINNIDIKGIKISRKSCISGSKSGCLGRSCLMANGDILPCGNIKVPIGNVNTINSYSEVSKHPTLAKMKNSIGCLAVTWAEGRL